MKKLFCSLAAVLVAVAAMAGNGLLWKVSGNGLTQPTYILGSHHLAPAEFVDSIPGLRNAIGEVSAVYGEVEKDALTSPEAQQKMLMMAMAPTDSTLSKVLTAEQLNKVDNMLAYYTGQPKLTISLEAMKPSFISAQIAVLMVMKEFPEMQVQQAFDAALMELAEKNGKPIGGLETLESQLQLVFGDPLTVQASDLMKVVEDKDEKVKQTRDLTTSYLKQDLDGVTHIMTSEEYGVQDGDLDRLIYNRNRAWVEELTELMPQKSMLVVVGAGHLGGDQGVLNLLKQKGYTVEPVEK